jgi:cytochrome c2
MKSVALHNRLNSILLKGLALFLFLCFGFSSYAQDVDEGRHKRGKGLFKSLCASCHKLDKKLVGPALGGVEERRENEW